ncbi:MAG: MBL fold metallo-hydrolase [Candidatus Krumholzibacteria bacterium]|nr:MBL fold metallo-hydrolase [Candidatus Krumholzibacteria bacterium]
MIRRTLPLLTCLAVLALSSPAVQAQGDFDKVEIQTTDLSHGLFMLKGAGGNIGLCVGPDGAFLIDDQYAPLTEKIVAAVAAVTDEPVGFVFNTHYHGDHTGGNESLGEMGSHLVSHTNVRRRLSVDQTSALLGSTAAAAAPGALPNITFTDSLTFHHNGQEIIAFHVPHAHTDGDGVLHFPQANVIHAGDVVFYGLYPYIDTAAGGSIDGMIAGVERIIGLCDDNTQVIPGHGPLVNKGQLTEYLNMLTRARANVAAEMGKGSDLAAVQAAQPCAEWDQSHGQTWLTSDQFVQSIFDSLTNAHDNHANHAEHSGHDH